MSGTELLKLIELGFDASKMAARRVDVENAMRRAAEAKAATLKARNAIVYVAGIKAKREADAITDPADVTPDQVRALLSAVGDLHGEIMQLELPPEQ